MTDSLKPLIELVPPPAVPFEAGSAPDFTKVEAELGLTLPEDYKRLVLTYGSGQWQEFWIVLNPFAASENISLLFHSRNQRPKKWSRLDATCTQY